ncbi:MAG: hypothetical protein AB1775_03500 [Bacteroidota bacterium]
MKSSEALQTKFEQNKDAIAGLSKKIRIRNATLSFKRHRNEFAGFNIRTGEEVYDSYIRYFHHESIDGSMKKREIPKSEYVEKWNSIVKENRVDLARIKELENKNLLIARARDEARVKELQDETNPIKQVKNSFAKTNNSKSNRDTSKINTDLVIEHIVNEIPLMMENEFEKQESLAKYGGVSETWISNKFRDENKQKLFVKELYNAIYARFEEIKDQIDRTDEAHSYADAMTSLIRRFSYIKGYSKELLNKKRTTRFSAETDLSKISNKNLDFKSRFGNQRIKDEAESEFD